MKKKTQRVSTKMLATPTGVWIPAHVKELVDFARMIMEDDELKIDEALLKSLEKLKKQRELIDNIRKEEKILKEIVKEGRIISGKNRKIINDAVASMKIAALSANTTALPADPKKPVAHLRRWA